MSNLPEALGVSLQVYLLWSLHQMRWGDDYWRQLSPTAGKRFRLRNRADECELRRA